MRRGHRPLGSDAGGKRGKTTGNLLEDAPRQPDWRMIDTQRPSPEFAVLRHSNCGRTTIVDFLHHYVAAGPEAYFVEPVVYQYLADLVAG